MLHANVVAATRFSVRPARNGWIEGYFSTVEIAYPDKFLFAILFSTGWTASTTLEPSVNSSARPKNAVIRGSGVEIKSYHGKISGRPALRRDALGCKRGELAGRGANAPANLTFALLDSIHAKADWVRCPPLPLYCRHWWPPLAPREPWQSPSPDATPPTDSFLPPSTPLHPLARPTSLAPARRLRLRLQLRLQLRLSASLPLVFGFSFAPDFGIAFDFDVRLRTADWQSTSGHRCNCLRL